MKWFNIAIDLKPNLLDSYHGFALCAFKIGRPAIALEYLDKAIYQLNDIDITEQFPDEDSGGENPGNAKDDEEPVERFGKVYFRYLRCLCNKILGNFEKSQEDY
jgi:tetratricopeptide (TPR) repeat protein